MRIGPDEPFRRYGHSKLYKPAEGRDLGFGPTKSRDIWSADLENPTLEWNMKWIGWPVAEIWPLEIFQNARSVGHQSSIHCCHVLLAEVLATWDKGHEAGNGNARQVGYGQQRSASKQLAELNTGSLPGLLDYVADLTFNVQGLAYDVQGLTSEVPCLRPGQIRPNLSPGLILCFHNEGSTRMW